MNDLLIGLGQRVRQLRDTKKWSQEEFAHVAGFHRTYIGQIERGEKNLSFTNLVKISHILGVTISELLVGLEDGSSCSPESKDATALDPNPAALRDTLEIRKLVERLGHQRTELDRTIEALEELIVVGRGKVKKPSARIL